MSLEGKCVELEITMLNETNPTQKFKDYMFLSSKGTNEAWRKGKEGKCD